MNIYTKIDWNVTNMDAGSDLVNLKYKQIFKYWLTDCTVCESVFNVLSVISRRPVYLWMLSWSSFTQYSAQ